MLNLESLTGPELKAIRRNAGLSQTGIAKLVGCSRDNVSYHETKLRPFRPKEYRWGCLAGTDLVGINPRSCFDVHHKDLLAEGKRLTMLKDFSLLCPTCHWIEHLRLKSGK